MTNIYCPILDKSFADKTSMLLALKANNDLIIAEKKAQTYKSHEKGQFSPSEQLKFVEDVEKSGFAMKDGYFYPIINTTNYMDSHGDVHFPNLWNKSLKDNNNQFYYVADHELKISSVIAFPQDVRAFTKTVDWSFIGKNYEGKTQALVYEIQDKSIQLREANNVIQNKIPMQNSVRMQYVKIFFAANSDHKDLVDENKLYHQYIDQIANKDVVNEQGYFYGVTEAKIIKEGSMVLFGSNDATPIRYKLNEAVTTDTSTKIEPSKDTHKKVSWSKISFTN